MTSMINVEQMRRFRAVIERALPALAKECNIEEFKLGKGKYDPSAGSFSFALEGRAEGGISADAARYNAEIEYNRSKRWPALGDTITWGGERLTVAGMGKGGAIYVTKLGKSYTIKRAQWDRAYGGIFDSPERKEAGVSP